MKNKFQVSTENIFCLGLFALAIMMVIGINACSKGVKMEDAKEVATEKNDERFGEKKENDADFLVNAAIISIEEIEFGKLAQSTSKTPEVISLGKMMEEDHTQSLMAIQMLAKKKGMTIPATLPDIGQAEYKKLLNETGPEFDRHYSNLMVKGHKEAIGLFAKAATYLTDPEIRAWASNTLPYLRLHLESAQACEKLSDNMKPPVVISK